MNDLTTRQENRVLQRHHVVIAVVLLAIIVVDIAMIASRRFSNTPVRIDMADAHDDPLQLDPDVASVQALASLPGMTRARAQAIVDYRNRPENRRQNGRCYRTLDDVDAVRGMGPKTLEKVKPYLCFPEPTEQETTKE